MEDMKPIKIEIEDMDAAIKWVGLAEAEIYDKKNKIIDNMFDINSDLMTKEEIDKEKASINQTIGAVRIMNGLIRNTGGRYKDGKN